MGRRVREVHATDMGGTHGLKRYATTGTVSGVCSICHTCHANLRTARHHVVNPMRNGRCHVGQSLRAPFVCPDPDCTCTFQHRLGCVQHAMRLHFTAWSPHHTLVQHAPVDVDTVRAVSPSKHRAHVLTTTAWQTGGCCPLEANGLGRKHLENEERQRKKRTTLSPRPRGQHWTPCSARVANSIPAGCDVLQSVPRTHSRIVRKMVEAGRAYAQTVGAPRPVTCS